MRTVSRVSRCNDPPRLQGGQGMITGDTAGPYKVPDKSLTKLNSPGDFSHNDPGPCSTIDPWSPSNPDSARALLLPLADS